MSQSYRIYQDWIEQVQKISVFDYTITDFEIDLGDFGHVEVEIDVKGEREGGSITFKVTDVRFNEKHFQFEKSFLVAECNREASALYGSIEARITDDLLDWCG